jgi:outer membrane receptor protein involved in Fe transport
LANFVRFGQEEFMKYMIEYAIRATGLTYDQNFAGSQALLNAFGKWKPEDGLTVYAFVSNLAGNGGYVLVEASDPKVIVTFVSKYNF